MSTASESSIQEDGESGHGDFQARVGIRLISRTGPNAGANVVWEFNL